MVQRDGCCNKPEVGRDPEACCNKPEVGRDPEACCNKPEVGRDPEACCNKPEVGRDTEACTPVRSTPGVFEKEWAGINDDCWLAKGRLVVIAA